MERFYFANVRRSCKFPFYILKKRRILNYMSLKTILSSIILLLIGITASGQITLNNPSFEDEPADATVPMGWFPCAPGTTPDILPGFWGVYSDPSEGETFVGLITRFDGSYESIGQRFSERLDKENCYSFMIDLAQSKTYAGYTEPLKVRIWIGNKKCKKEQLIYESDFITHPNWKTYEVNFTPEMNARYIMIEAFYTEGEISRMGNILIDNITTLLPCSKV